MRHSDIKITSDTYAHISLTDMAAELEKLPEFSSSVTNAESLSDPMDTLRDTFPVDSNESLYNSVDEEISAAEALERLYLAMTQQKSPVSSGETGQQNWHPLGDSNPCSQTENLMC